MTKRLSSSEELHGNSCGDTSSPIFAQTTSSTFYSPNHSASTSVHVPATTHRIQRFISFFSSGDTQTKHWETTSSPTTVRFPSRRRLKRSTTATTTPISASLLATPIPLGDVQKQGQLMHQEMAMGEPVKNDRHKWTTYWVVLHGTKLYLCCQLSSHINDETHEKLLNIPSDARQIDLKSAIVDIAYEYCRSKDNKKAHVFRVITQQQTEHHFQTYCEDDMLKWIEIIRFASSNLISSQSDHGTVSTGVTSNIDLSSNVPNNWSTVTKFQSDNNSVSHAFFFLIS
uniref:PH domain-containing protein n=1 Tax=Loa loa TaxID=7209 RepID=A0A1I7VZM4_LOALO